MLLIGVMPERLPVAPRPSVRSVTAAVDVVLLTPRDGAISVLLLRAPDNQARDRWLLPWDSLRAEEAPEVAAARIARGALGVGPSSLEQLVTLGDGRRHPGDARLTVAYLGLVPQGSSASIGAVWVPVDRLPVIAPRQRATV